MKLELKHLAPYLPYGLKGLGKFPNGKNNIRDINVNNIMAFVDNDINSKPILRPLSDLAKETEYGGMFDHQYFRVQVGQFIFGKRDYRNWTKRQFRNLGY